MGKKTKARKSGSSLIMSIPADIGELMGVKEGREFDLEPFTTNSLQLKVLK